MKGIIAILLLSISVSAIGQQAFSVGASGMTIKAGTIVSVDSLVLTPSADYTIATNALTATYAATSGPGASSISPVYSFTNALGAYSGGVGIYYTAAELNGNNAAALSIAYSGDGATWALDHTGTYTANYVNTGATAFAGNAIKTITAVSTGKYYSKSTGDITLTTNWGTNADGSGNNPADFAGTLNTYELKNIATGTTLLNNWSIGGLFIIDSGIDLEIGNNTLTLADSIQCNGTIGGNRNSTLTISGKAMSVRFNTSANVIRTVGISNNAQLTLLDTLSIASDSLLGVITVGTGGVLNTNNFLKLRSDSNGTARIGNVAGSIVGTVTVQQYTPAGRRAYRFWAHPFTTAISLAQIQSCIDITGAGGVSQGFTPTVSNAPSAYWYNNAYGNSSMGTDPGWRAFTNTYGTPDSNMLHPYQGMRLYIRGAKGEGLTGASYIVDPATIIMSGTVNTGTITEPLTTGSLMVAGSPVQNYNLLGNPYPSPVDINTVIANASSAGYIYGAAFYLWNPYLGTSGQFVTKTIGSSCIIPANASFEVRASAAAGASLTFNESNKAVIPTDVTHRSQGNDIGLYIYDTSYHLWDMLYVRFNSNATDSEDEQYDGGKPSGPASLNFYTLSASHTKLSIDARPYKAGVTIPLGISSSYLQQFIIKADEFISTPGNAIYLHDKYLQTYTLLAQGAEYKFAVTTDAASQGDDRFELSLDTVSLTVTQVDKLPAIELAPNPASGWVMLTYATVGNAAKRITIANVAGVNLYSEALGSGSSGNAKIDLDKFVPGIYLVTFYMGDRHIVKRLVIDQ